MTQKYDATVDYAKYLELAKEAKELEALLEDKLKGVKEDLDELKKKLPSS